MGNTVAGDLSSPLEDADMKTWRKNAKELQTYIYLQYKGCQFHDFTDLSRELRITNICFSIYGPPTENAGDLDCVYKSDQRKFAGEVYEKIVEVSKEAPEKKFLLGTLFISCKEQASEKEKRKEYQVPLFRLLWEKEKKPDGSYNVISRFIDISLRVYDSVDDWRENNTMPMMDYCYPTNLFYTCHSDSNEKFASDPEPTLTFGTSPACNLSSRVLRTADTVFTVFGLSFAVTALCTPANFISAPIILVVGATSGAYSVGRSVQRLYDKMRHGESLSDTESILLFAGIAASPINSLSMLVNSRLAIAAARGIIYSKTQRVLATLLNWSTLSLDSFSFIVGLSSLITKHNEGNLTELDVLQFSVNTLFFANTLIQPKTANGVIAEASKRINQDTNPMSDDAVKNVFQQFLVKSKKRGDIEETPKSILSLSKIEDSKKV
uniref:DUF4781 domain-containing protein n=1 Tax=Caenorhabditis japonica TaxID=281687 RepID=A0A8R1DHH0_CAEJA